MSKSELVLVPRVPTPEMREAFHTSYEAYEEGRGECPDSQWAAMIRAAPEAQKQPVGYLDRVPGNDFGFRSIKCSPHAYYKIPVYLHADPAEVERLRYAEKEAHAAYSAQFRLAEQLRAQLAERDALLGAIAGWTTETRAAVLEAFQDELNESASYAWYDAAIADLMKLVEALSASAEPSAPEVIEYSVCIDCFTSIAQGVNDNTSEAEDEHLDMRMRDELDGREGHWVEGVPPTEDDPEGQGFDEFSTAQCELCMDHRGGSRHGVSLVIPKK